MGKASSNISLLIEYYFVPDTNGVCGLEVITIDVPGGFGVVAVSTVTRDVGKSATIVCCGNRLMKTQKDVRVMFTLTSTSLPSTETILEAFLRMRWWRVPSIDPSVLTKT